LLSTAVVAVDMAAAAVEGTAEDLAAVAIAAGLEAAAIAVDLLVDTAVAMQVASQAAPAAMPVDTAAERTTLLALDTQQDFAVATLAGASHPSMRTADT